MAEKADPLNPSAVVLVALGSAVVHAEEFFSSSGAPEDKIAFESCLKMPEVREWIAAMTDLALLPVKR
jgi:hypothetical protein